MYVSYCEYCLEAGELVGHLGSGAAEAILDRYKIDPCIRICIQEPPEDHVEFRAQCGHAELTSTGPVPLPSNDPTELRGAWIRIIPVGAHVGRLLRDAWRNRNSDPGIASGLTSGWVEVEGNVLKEISQASAHKALAETILSEPETRPFVRIEGTPDQIWEVLALINSAPPFDCLADI